MNDFPRTRSRNRHKQEGREDRKWQDKALPLSRTKKSQPPFQLSRLHYPLSLQPPTLLAPFVPIKGWHHPNAGLGGHIGCIATTTMKVFENLELCRIN